MAKRDQPIDHTMSFGDHLEELRRRLFLAFLPVLPLAVIGYALSDTLIDCLLLPLYRALASKGLPQQIQTLSPPEAILTQFKLSIIAAVIVSAPWMFWQFWKFLAPGLYQHERRFVNFLVPGSALLTIAGVLLMYFGMLPLMLRVLISIGASMSTHAPPPTIDPRAQQILVNNPSVQVYTHQPEHPIAGQAWLLWPDMKLYVAALDAAGAVQIIDVPRPAQSSVAQLFRLSDYISFVLLLFLGIVIAFQMPLVILLLGWMGLASPQWLRDKRRYAVMICALVAVVITPGDVVSMLVMMVPLYGLYELGILLLVMAPASAVAEGRVFSLRRFRSKRSDNPREPMDQPRKAAQPDLTVARGRSEGDLTGSDADGGENTL